MRSSELECAGALRCSQGVLSDDRTRQYSHMGNPALGEFPLEGEPQTKALICLAALVVIPLLAVGSEPAPPWAFALTPASYVPPPDNGSERHVPGSTATYTQTQIDDNFNAPDWFPSEHRPMPPVVAHGDGTTVWACAKCHLTSGLGHPESAGLAGLSASYIAQQIAAYKDGSRKGSAKMVQIAQAMSDDDTVQAAKWFSQLPRRPWIRVVETTSVPVTFITDGNMRLQSPGSATEALADRIIEVPQDQERTRSRDPYSGFIAYVPPGSLGRGMLTHQHRRPWRTAVRAVI
jgi:hypothetical protein